VSTGYPGGGGILCYNAEPLIRSNRITNNTADNAGDGGGIACCFLSPVITNNMIHGNEAFRGGGIDCWHSTPILTNNTLTGNIASYGGGIHASNLSPATVTNSIFWDNIAPNHPEIYDSGNMNVMKCDVKGGWPGFGNIDEDPLFVDQEDFDLHLRFTSPCKDLGLNGAPGIEELDFEGDPRIVDGKVDMGADEFHTHLYYTGDAEPGGEVEFKVVGIPGTSPVQLWLGSGVLNPPLHTKYGDWYLQFPILVQLGLGAIPSPDGVLVLSFTFPPDTPAPLSLPFQAGVGMVLTNLSVMDVE
jgi:hypothetical protein